MYGIVTLDSSRVLCHLPSSNSYVLKEWYRTRNPVMRNSATEINRLLHYYIAASNYYGVRIYYFSEEETENILIMNLKGF